MIAQASLFEPLPNEAISLCATHLARAAKHRRLADVFEARGMRVLAAQALTLEAHEYSEADDLNAFADLCSLAGVLS